MLLKRRVCRFCVKTNWIEDINNKIHGEKGKRIVRKFYFLLSVFKACTTH